MKLYPYSRIKTHNLKTLLLVSRIMGAIGYLVILVVIGMEILIFFTGPQTIYGLAGNPIISMPAPTHGGILLLTSLASIATAFSFFIISGLCAAVVSFEYKYTKEQ